MPTVTVTSENARLRWRETIDAAYADKKTVVIERHNLPVVAVVNYEQLQKERARLKELELAAELRRVQDKIARGEAKFTSGEELLQLIMEKRANAVNPANPAVED
jgi:PHD/YefM family antitoxin component YafN of YafNO toxin-antitoxin module